MYDFIGRGLPAVILLVLMRNPDQAYGRSNDDNDDHQRSGGRGRESGRGGSGGGGGGGGGGGTSSGGGLTTENVERRTNDSSPGAGLWSSGEDQGHYSDWPSESSRSQYGALSEDDVVHQNNVNNVGYNGSHLHHQSLGSDEFVE